MRAVHTLLLFRSQSLAASSSLDDAVSQVFAHAAADFRYSVEEALRALSDHHLPPDVIGISTSRSALSPRP